MLTGRFERGRIGHLRLDFDKITDFFESVERKNEFEAAVGNMGGPARFDDRSGRTKTEPRQKPCPVVEERAIRFFVFFSAFFVKKTEGKLNLLPRFRLGVEFRAFVRYPKFPAGLPNPERFVSLPKIAAEMLKIEVVFHKFRPKFSPKLLPEPINKPRRVVKPKFHLRFDHSQPLFVIFLRPLYYNRIFPAKQENALDPLGKIGYSPAKDHF